MEGVKLSVQNVTIARHLFQTFGYAEILSSTFGYFCVRSLQTIHLFIVILYRLFPRNSDNSDKSTQIQTNMGINCKQFKLKFKKATQNSCREMAWLKTIQLSLKHRSFRIDPSARAGMSPATTDTKAVGFFPSITKHIRPTSMIHVESARVESAEIKKH